MDYGQDYGAMLRVNYACRDSFLCMRRDENKNVIMVSMLLGAWRVMGKVYEMLSLVWIRFMSSKSV